MSATDTPLVIFMEEHLLLKIIITQWQLLM
jgi:hypothetical protein